MYSISTCICTSHLLCPSCNLRSILERIIGTHTRPLVHTYVYVYMYAYCVYDCGEMFGITGMVEVDITPVHAGAWLIGGGCKVQ